MSRSYQACYWRSVQVILILLLAMGWGASAVADDAAEASENDSGVTVYSNDFQKRPGDEWSRRPMDVTPNKERKFLGMFRNKTTLSLKDLPEHTMLRIRFDLYLFGTWDGCTSQWGPEDRWRLGVEDGPTLIHTTFSNCGLYWSNNNQQNFPDNYFKTRPAGWRPYASTTGATERQTLGYLHRRRGDSREYKFDSVYQFDLMIPHFQKTVAFTFQSIYRDSLIDQSWGLDNVRVEALPERTALDEQELMQCWESLGASDPEEAFDATWKLIASDYQPAGLFKKQFTSPDRDKITPIQQARAVHVLRVVNRENARVLARDIIRGKLAPSANAPVPKTLVPKASPFDRILPSPDPSKPVPKTPSFFQRLIPGPPR